MKNTIFASAMLIAGAILIGFSIWSDSDWMIVGAILMGLGILMHFGKSIVHFLSKYFSTYYPKNENKEQK